jgi:hypothetical protein
LDVVKAVQELLDGISKLADKDPTGLLAAAILLSVFIFFLFMVWRVIRTGVRSLASLLPSQRRAKADQMTNSIAQQTVTALNKAMEILDKHEETSRVGAENTKRLVEQAANRTERDEKQEALLAGLMGKSAGLEEAVRTLSSAVEALINRSDKSETAEVAQSGRKTAVEQINQHTTELIKPVTDAMQAIPPNLLTINTTLTQLPANITNSFQTLIISERDAARAELASVTAERDALRTQLAGFQSLPGVVAAQDEKLKVLSIENARLAALVVPSEAVPAPERGASQ